MIGKVIWFDSKKGYGFIRQNDNSDIFVHFSDIILNGFKELKKEQKVNYNIGYNYFGKIKAINVEII